MPETVEARFASRDAAPIDGRVVMTQLKTGQDHPSVGWNGIGWVVAPGPDGPRELRVRVDLVTPTEPHPRLEVGQWLACVMAVRAGYSLHKLAAHPLAIDQAAPALEALGDWLGTGADVLLTISPSSPDTSG